MVKTKAKPKVKAKEKKVAKATKLAEVVEELDEDLGGEITVNLEDDEDSSPRVEQTDIHVVVRASKPVSKVKKGDKVKVDGKELEVDSHYILIDHGTTKEMTIELFDPKTDKDYQLRYFDDQVEATIEFYELQEILYIKKPIIKVEW